MAKKPENTSFDRTLAEIRSQFADLTPEQLEAFIDEAVAAAREGQPAPPARNLFERIRTRLEPLGGADDLDLPPRAELFIVTSIIAWTYLLHAFFTREGIDYRYFQTVNGAREVKKTENGAENYWELGRCLRDPKCPLDKATKTNLEFLTELRHEIEHRSTNRIDDAVSAKLKACCINFNETVKRLFGLQYGLERRLPIALQFVTFSADQQAVLKRASDLPHHIETMMDAFHQRLTPDEQADPRFAYRVRPEGP